MQAIERKSRHSKTEKKAALDLYDTFIEELDGCHFAALTRSVSLLKETRKYSWLKKRILSAWVKARSKARERAALSPTFSQFQRVKRGFEREVWAQLVVTKSELMYVAETEEDTVLHNVVFSRPIIKEAAESVKGLLKYRDVEQIQRLSFSDGWINDFLTSQGFRLKKLTKEEKPTLSDAAVAELMSQRQNEIIKGNYTEDRVWNLDETALRYLLGPCRIYMPSGQNRGEFISDEKSRVTLVVNINAAGRFAPLMFIIKCSKSTKKSRVEGDESSTRVIQAMAKLPGFTEKDGWEKSALWMGNYTVVGDTGPRERECKVWFLRHSITGDVITCQAKAWNDTARMLMYVELILDPIARITRPAEQSGTRNKFNRGGHFLWMDNFSVHNNKDVLQALTNKGVVVGFYPPNMTGDLQILDLVVNRLLKQLMRRLREGEIVEHFRKFKSTLLEMKDKWSKQKLLSEKFRPPKPLLHDRILAMMNYVQQLSNGDGVKEIFFRESVRKTFLSTGSFHDGSERFVRYSSTASADQGAISAGRDRPLYIDMTLEDALEDAVEGADVDDSDSDDENNDDSDDGSDDDNDNDDE
jgi:hypothetical protein